MSTIYQYLPGFFDPVNIKRHEAQAETREQLEAIEWIAYHKTRDGFHQFSRDGKHLMAEYNDGRNWDVVARLAEPKRYGLPAWYPNRSEAVK